MIGDDEIPDAPLLVEIQIIQGKNMTTKKDPYVMIKVGGDEVYRTPTAKKVFNPVWQSEPYVSKYQAEADGPIYLEVASGKGSSQAIIGRSLIPLRGEEERKTGREQQPAIWLKVAGSTTPEPTELQISVLSEPIIREANVTLVREKKPVRLVLIADTLYVFSDPDTYKRLKRRVSLGIGAKMHRAQGSTELHIEGAAALTATNGSNSGSSGGGGGGGGGSGGDDPFVFRTENEAEATAWEEALRPFVGPVSTPVFGASLAAAMRIDHLLCPWNTSGIPAFVNSGLKFIEEHGLEEQGIFRIGYMSYAIDDAIRRIETGQRFVEDFDSVHMVSNVLKKYFRSLPEPLVPRSIMDEVFVLFEKAGGAADGSSKGSPRQKAQPAVEDVATVFAKLPAENAGIVGRLFKLCANICKHKDINMMTDGNLSIVVGPSVFCVDAEADDAGLVALLPKINILTLYLIEHASELFSPHRQHSPLPTKLSSYRLQAPKTPATAATQPPPPVPPRTEINTSKGGNEEGFDVNTDSAAVVNGENNEETDKFSTEKAKSAAATTSQSPQAKCPPPVPPRKKVQSTVNLFKPIDPDDLEAALKQGLALYNVYGNGGGPKGWVEEEGFCNLLMDLGYAETPDKAREVLAQMCPEMRVCRNKFVTWWMDSHETIIPFSTLN